MSEELLVRGGEDLERALRISMQADEAGLENRLACQARVEPVAVDARVVVIVLDQLGEGLDAQAAAAVAAAMEQELRKMDAEAMRARTQQEAAVEAQSLKAERAESSAKKGKSLGEWLFGL